MGSGALFFRVRPGKSVLGDINEGLIESYEVVRVRPDDVHAAVSEIARTERRYYQVRALRPDDLSPFDRAVRFVYLNRLCFNGIFRTNARGEFNVPFAHSRAGRIPSVREFRLVALALADATLKAGDFGTILSGARKGDFVYLDPPYAVEARRIFRQYDARAFRAHDLERLGEHLNTLNSKGASFVVSYADCREARALFRNWRTRRIKVRRNVAGFAADRRMAVELVATNIDVERPHKC